MKYTQNTIEEQNFNQLAAIINGNKTILETNSNYGIEDSMVKDELFKNERAASCDMKPICV